MPGEQQIFRGAVVAAPNDYTVGGDVELRLRQVNAVFDGSGAASAYLPAVVLESDSGHIIGRYVNRSEPIAAGASAEVTWFPGGGLGGGASSSVIAWAIIGSGSTATVIAPDVNTGNPTPIPFEAATFVEDGSGVFSFDPGNPVVVQCSETPINGIYFVSAGFETDNLAPGGPSVDDVGAFTFAQDPPGGFQFSFGVDTVGTNQGLPNPGTTEYFFGLNTVGISDGSLTAPIGFGFNVLNTNASGDDLRVIGVTFQVVLLAV